MPHIHHVPNPILLWPSIRILLLVLSIVYLVWKGYLTAHGYCHNQHRYLSDEDYILIAMFHTSYHMSLHDTDSPLDYLRKHPECCTVNRPPLSVLRNVLGYVVEVEVNFELKPTAIRYPAYRYYKEYVEVTACGQRGNIFGESRTTLESAIQPSKPKE